MIFNEVTSHFEPLKFSRVHVELAYSAPRSSHVWVLIINGDGIVENMKVEVIYSALPFSCNLCKVFGHSLARCINNPEIVKNRQEAHARKQAQQADEQDRAANAANDYTVNTEHNEHGEYDDHNDFSHKVVGELFGCSVVQNDDEHIDREVLENDDLETFDQARDGDDSALED
ncbi:hypothetical protein AgCh_027799 [Apium graveolens]